VKQRSRYAALLAAAGFIVQFTGAAMAATQAGVAMDEASALRISQAAIGRTLQDHVFTDTRKETVRLTGFRGKPLVLNLVYTSCYHTCPLVVQSLARAADVARDALGPDSFNIVTIGFDTRADTPERMRDYARSQGIDLPNWRFVSADARTIDALIADVGFVFYPSPRGFDHLAQTTIIDEKGVIYRQLYGSDFGPQALVEPMRAMALGQTGNLLTVSGIVKRVRLFCTIYDVNSERYRFNYSIFVGGAIGGASLLALGVVLFRAWRRQRTIGKA
jgi:protein SCO1/2